MARLLFLLGLFLLLLLRAAGQQLPAGMPNRLTYLPNRGQWPAAVRLRASVGPGLLLFAETQRLTWLRYDAGALSGWAHQVQVRAMDSTAASPGGVPAHAWAVEFVDANPAVALQPEGAPVGPARNYMLGADPTRWASGVRATPAGRYAELWPGIDLRLHASAAGEFEYDVELAPGANLARAVFHYRGLEKIWLEPTTGHLHLRTALGELTEAAPVAWQLDPRTGQRQPVACRFRLTTEAAAPGPVAAFVSFELPEGYDRTRALTIDPVLVFGTYSGSTSMVFGQTATYDAQGRLYSAGPSFEPGYPTTLGAFDLTHSEPDSLGALAFAINPDVAVSCYSADGRQLRYATYLGGGFPENPISLLVNHHGDLLILGSTNSPDFPTSATAYDRSFNGSWGKTDIFLAKLDSTGSQLLASTFVGGANDDGISPYSLPFFYGDRYRGDLAVDSLDRLYVTTTTSSSDFPYTAGALRPVFGQPAATVVMRLAPDLSGVDWAAGFGAQSAGYNMYLPPSGAPYVVGTTVSYGMPATPGTLDTTTISNPRYYQRDGFIAQLSPAGDSIRAMTYLRPGTVGRPKSQAFFVQPVPGSSDLLVLGSSTGDYPMSRGKWGQPGGGLVLQRLSADLRRRRWITTIGHPVSGGQIGPAGGTTNLSPTAFLVDRCGAIYLTGWGNTAGLPVSPNAAQPVTDGWDLYLAVLKPEAVGLEYATYLGGHSVDNTGEEHVDGGTCRFDPQGRTYHAVCTNAHDFPTTPGAWHPLNSVRDNANDIVSFKFDFQRRLVTAGALATNALGSPGAPLVAPATVQLVNLSTAFPGTTYSWSFGDGSAPSTAVAPQHQYELPGTYRLTLIARDPGSCAGADTTHLTLTIAPDASTDYQRYTVCHGDSVRFTTIGAQPGSLQWEPAASLSDLATLTPWAAPLTTTTYVASGLLPNSATPHIWRVTVAVTPTDSVRLTTSQHCQASGSTAELHLSSPLRNAAWAFGDGDTLTTPGPATDVTHFYAADAAAPEYTVRVRGLDSHGCLIRLQQTIRPSPLLPPNILTPGTRDGLNDAFQLSCLEPGTATLRVYNRWGRPVFDSGRQQYANQWTGEGLPAGLYYYLLDLSYAPRPYRGWVEVVR